ncbi:MAG: glycosyltransferase family 4 protein [Pyrinomonadaceae bacterium]
MHIVFVIANESSVPYFNWFADEARNHPDVKFTFVALYGKRPAMLDEMPEKGFDAHWFEFDPSNRKSGMVRNLFRLYKLFRKIKPDVVHTHLFDDSVPGMLAARLAGVKRRVITKQDTTYHWYYAPKWVWFDKFNNWNATHVHAVATENERFILENEKAPREKVHLVRNGFPYDLMTASKQEHIDEIKREYGMDGRFVVGTVARYIHWKGHHLIIEAAKEIAKKHPEILFVWAGSDGGSGYKDELQKMVDDAGLSGNITLLGWIDRFKMPSLYKCMDAYLHPAVREPFGFAISEAFMNGVAVAATKTGSTDLVTHLENAYLLEMDSVDDIVKAISMFIEDPEKRKAIADAGHEHALEHLQFKNMWDGHMGMYEGRG